MLQKLEDANQEVIRARNDPFLLAVNGAMTLGFLISVLICMFGFLLYWVLSMNGRVRQIGVYRAIGLPFSQLVAMLAAEQILTSGAAVAIGAATGNAVSRLFVPMFRLSFDPSTQVPPFRVVFEWADQVRLYGLVFAIIVTGLLLLGVLLFRVKIHQAVKLGED